MAIRTTSRYFLKSLKKSSIKGTQAAWKESEVSKRFVPRKRQCTDKIEKMIWNQHIQENHLEASKLQRKTLLEWIHSSNRVLTNTYTSSRKTRIFYSFWISRVHRLNFHRSSWISPSESPSFISQFRYQMGIFIWSEAVYHRM